MRKRTLCAIMSAVMIAGAMTGCGSNESASAGSANDVMVQGKISASEAKVKRQNAGAVDAYKKFYGDFYAKHMSNDENLKEADCAAKLVMDANGNLLLAITDMQSFDNKYDVLLDLYIYEYKNKEVVQKVKIPNIKAWDDGMGIATAGDNILVWTGYSNGDSLFIINGNEYKEIKDSGLRGEHRTVKTGLGEYARDAGLLTRLGRSLVNLFFSDGYSAVKFCVHGQDFQDWLNYYSDNQVTSSLKLDILYADYLEKNRYYELENGEHLTQYIIYWKDGIYYGYIPAGDSYDGMTVKENSLYIKRFEEFEPYIDEPYLNEKTLSSIPDNIDGIKVVVSDKCKDVILQTVSRNAWKKTYVDYFKDKSESVINPCFIELNGNGYNARLLFYITSDKSYKLYYIDGSGVVQELLNTYETVRSCRKYSKSDAISIDIGSENYKYQYDKNTGRFVKVDNAEALGRDDSGWFNGTMYENEQKVLSEWLIDAIN